MANEGRTLPWKESWFQSAGLSLQALPQSLGGATRQKASSPLRYTKVLCWGFPKREPTLAGL